MILVDTSLIIDFLRIKNKENSWFYQLVQSKKKLCVSIVTHTELYAGKSVWEERKAKEELNTIFSCLELISLGIEISKDAGQIRAIYSLNLLDAIIAATAIKKKLPLATLNEKHFKKVANLNLLKRESSA